jgi:predicted amidohydrolase
MVWGENAYLDGINEIEHRNTNVGIALLKKSAEFNNEAQFALGVLYLAGRYGIKQDKIQGMHYLELSKKNGNSKALFLLSNLKNTPVDNKKGNYKKIGVAAVCMRESLEPKQNRIKMLHFINEIKAKHNDVRLIVFGETAPSYYHRQHDSAGYINNVAENIDGDTFQLMSKAAKENDVYISYGIFEKDTNKIYNTQVMLNPKGNIQSKYRKHNLVPFDTDNDIQPGNGIVIDRIDDFDIATIICYDAVYLQVLKELNQHSVDALIISAANTSVKSFSLDYPLLKFWLSPYLIVANRIGAEDDIAYDGQFGIFSPGGVPLDIDVNHEGYIYEYIWKVARPHYVMKED